MCFLALRLPLDLAAFLTSPPPTFFVRFFIFPILLLGILFLVIPLAYVSLFRSKRRRLWFEIKEKRNATKTSVVFKTLDRRWRGVPIDAGIKWVEEEDAFIVKPEVMQFRILRSFVETDGPSLGK